MKRSGFGSALLLTLVVARAGAAPSDTEQSLAQSLFDQAKQLMAAGNYEAACPKLEESQRLDPSGGTLLNLALCHENQGKLASAWTEFKEAVSAAKRDGRAERVAGAEEHIRALEPKLPWLTLAVAEPAEGQEVKLDGGAVGRAAWGVPFSLDPGQHALEVRAPGRKPWNQALTIAVAERKTVSVPVLDADPNVVTPTPAPAVVAAEPKPPEQESSKGKGTSTLGWVIGGAGVAALGVGTYFGIDAINKKNESDERCPSDDTCTPRGVELNNQANTSAWIANFGIGLGLVGIGAGTYLLLTGQGAASAPPKAASRGLRFDASALPGGARASLTGAW